MNITVHQFKQLKRLYKQAVKQGKEQFSFNGQVLLTQFAKYLIEHIESTYQV